VERSLDWGFDQPEAMGQADARPEGSERAIRLKQGIAATRAREENSQQQALKGCVHPGNPHQNRSAATLFEHLQSNGAYGRGSALQGLIHCDVGQGSDPRRTWTASPPTLQWACVALREPEFFTLLQAFIREHQEPISTWAKVRRKKLEDQIQAFKNEKGFEQIANALGIPQPRKIR
jgi:hypothetical protein